MSKLINCLIKEISKTNPQFSDLQLKKMEYGLLCAIDEITKLIPYFIIFWFFSVQKYYIIILIFFAPIRLFTGGYHAKTYWGCFFITFVIFSLIITIGKYLSFNTITLILSLVVSFILVCIYAPVDNINKRIKNKERKLKLKYFSIIITFCLSILCYFVPYEFLSTAVLSIASAIILMMIGKINNRKSPTLL
jgi:Membrane protein putatively involved in post-translational modification of the autoinducing quorum-sensing peptide